MGRGRGRGRREGGESFENNKTLKSGKLSI